MQLIQDKIEENLQENYQHLKLLDVEIFNFLSQQSNRYKSDQAIDAVVLLNWALLHLDHEPDDTYREVHVLLGDYLLSQFYRLLAQEDAKLLRDMMQISKSVQSSKSEAINSQDKYSVESLKRILFQPLLYLVDNEYVSRDLDDVLSQVIKRNLEHTEIHYKDVI